MSKITKTGSFKFERSSDPVTNKHIDYINERLHLLDPKFVDSPRENGGIWKFKEKVQLIRYGSFCIRGRYTYSETKDAGVIFDQNNNRIGTFVKTYEQGGTFVVQLDNNIITGTFQYKQ